MWKERKHFNSTFEDAKINPIKRENKFILETEINHFKGKVLWKWVLWCKNRLSLTNYMESK